ncbi:MAG: hypothetical protein GWN01_13095 [Nitrosopumilaceae archaeon]|nr:hypothetical protein [Nitrosopumilaceae archaeon]NIU01800.1 hypothetical protein [Nitrosopumilaceae archaeon]NIU88200.1 hypothetical protein [Nitrosopumilaceae archaeon]NIV66523.1 hypothetical protein [Nitrosopumilaceae archaeon]NIX62402.1 hypothetical protein [Nitrosopumilaceae archaeon]
MKNTKLFLISVILIVFGGTIILFDYPQLQYLDNLGIEYQRLDSEQMAIHQRLQIEFAAGIGILAVGGLTFLLSVFRKTNSE